MADQAQDPTAVAAGTAIRLRILLPTRVLLDEAASKVIAEAENGSFCLLPRHADFVAALVPGILLFTVDGRERYVAVDAGILVKCGDDVMVSVHDAVAGDDLAGLRDTVAREFRQLDEHERIARSALARLEAGVVRRFIELERVLP